MRTAAWLTPPHKERPYLSGFSSLGYVAGSATIHHDDLEIDGHIFVDERVVIFQRETGGSTKIGERVYIYRDTIIETGYGGSLMIGDKTSIHPRCQINAYVVHIEIGENVMIAPNCAIYSYDHSIEAGQPISAQPLKSRGPIRIGDGAWLGFGVIVLSGVTIGKGAAVGAGSVVTQDIPDFAIAVGNPARVVKMR